MVFGSNQLSPELAWQLHPAFPPVRTFSGLKSRDVPLARPMDADVGFVVTCSSAPRCAAVVLSDHYPLSLRPPQTEQAAKEQTSIASRQLD